MGTLSIIALCLLFLLNGITVGVSYESDMKYQLNWRAYLAIILGCSLGSIILLLWVIGYYVYQFWLNVIWSEISFYYRFYRTSFFDDLISKDVNLLYRYNDTVERYKNDSSWSSKRLKRHVNAINLKFKYDYETDKKDRALLMQQAEKDWDE